MTALNAIGVVPDEAVDPAREFSELGNIKHAWMSGAVHPTSMRGLASLLTTLLPKETLATLGMAFIEAGLEDDPPSEGEELALPKRIQALDKIAAMQKEGLDYLTPEPFVSINPWASIRQVDREINHLLNDWKKELDLEEIRERSKKHEAYFEVWDLREGWTAGRYVAGQGKLLVEVAEYLDRPLQTVNSQYKKAFELITGHPYCPESFVHLFGSIRFQGIFTDGADTKYRPRNDKPVKSVNESTLGISAEEVSNSHDRQTTKAAFTYSHEDFTADYRSLAAKGMTDREIASELEIENYESFLKLIEHFK